MIKKFLFVSIYLVLLSFFILSGCSKDETTTNPLPTTNKGVYILNEGTWNNNNSELSFYDLSKNEVSNNVFFSANNRPLGDVANSMIIHNDKAYIVVSNSNKIEIINLTDYKSVKTINVGNNRNPQQLILVNSSKGYTTNLNSNSVAIIDIINGNVVDTIAVGAKPEFIEIANNKAYISNSGFGSGNTLSVIGISDNQVIKTITVDYNPGMIKLAPNGKLYLVCRGSYNPNVDGNILVIDPNTDTVIDTIVVGGKYIGDICIGSDGIGYLVGPFGTNRIIKFDTNNNKIVDTSWANGFTNAYTVAVDNVNKKVYISDAKDFKTSGTVSIYNFNGIKEKDIIVGIAPGTILFNL